MYLVYVAGLILGVYLAPGLALAPRAAFDSRLAYAVPILSVLIVTTLARILKPLGLFTETIVFSATLAFAVIAAWRPLQTSLNGVRPLAGGSSSGVSVQRLRGVTHRGQARNLQL